MSDRKEHPNMRILPAGIIEVSPRAIASIAAQAVCRSYGVVGMAPANLRDSVVQVLRQEDQHRGIEVHIGKDGIVVDLYVVLEYGTRISEVAQQVIATVSYALNKALGRPVAAVNVHVQGIRID
ncbi:Asp23/Gls24 family envelope stress response protein [Kallotenue papyrolyticum]|uniref:Asp23/Gls24 family envelope stress response protein n=1 Tax=Kallotenue papyrolyticum TaxID=1325125 RepID=UPI0004B36184|nr:Asp23/Gls24 family envelope stress response protein [Kallotenue papyrolyticum]